MAKTIPLWKALELTPARLTERLANVRDGVMERRNRHEQISSAVHSVAVVTGTRLHSHFVPNLAARRP
jgi:hypothetical protein